MRCCRKTNSFKDDRAIFCSVLPVTWHKNSSCGACWQLQGGEAYKLVREMGEMGEAEYQVVTITTQNQNQNSPHRGTLG